MSSLYTDMNNLEQKIRKIQIERAMDIEPIQNIYKRVKQSVNFEIDDSELKKLIVHNVVCFIEKTGSELDVKTQNIVAEKLVKHLNSKNNK